MTASKPVARANHDRGGVALVGEQESAQDMLDLGIDNP